MSKPASQKEAAEMINAAIQKQKIKMLGAMDSKDYDTIARCSKIIEIYKKMLKSVEIC